MYCLVLHTCSKFYLNNNPSYCGNFYSEKLFIWIKSTAHLPSQLTSKCWKEIHKILLINLCVEINLNLLHFSHNLQKNCDALVVPIFYKNKLPTHQSQILFENLILLILHDSWYKNMNYFSNCKKNIYFDYSNLDKYRYFCKWT